MNRYKVLKGRHVVDDRIYIPDEVVETDSDLVKIWGGDRFQLLSEDVELEDAPVREVSDTMEDLLPDDESEEEPEEESEHTFGRKKRGRPRK